MPIGGQGVYDRFGHLYNVSQILDSTGRRFDLSKYEAYSALYLPGSFAMLYLLAFTLSTALLVHTILYHGRTIYNGIRRVPVEKDDVHMTLMGAYPEVPDSWYAGIFLLFFVVAIVTVVVWPTDMPVWALAFSILVPMLYLLPCGFIFAVTGMPTSMSVNLLAQVIPGMLLNGRPLANMVRLVSYYCPFFLSCIVNKIGGQLTNSRPFSLLVRTLTRSLKATLSRQSLRRLSSLRTSSWATTLRSRPVRRLWLSPSLPYSLGSCKSA